MSGTRSTAVEHRKQDPYPTAGRAMVTVQNVNVPGHSARVDAAKYEAMRSALLKVLPPGPPGLTQAQMFAAVKPHLPTALFPGGAKSGWWAKTVQLDLEAKRLVSREATKPLRWHRTGASDLHTGPQRSQRPANATSPGGALRRIRYKVAVSLDGYIAGPDGEADWIVADPDIDFEAIFKEFDTLLIGRRTFEGMVRAGKPGVPGMRTFVLSRTLRPRDYPDVTILAEGWEEELVALRSEPGKDIWLFGGGSLFRSLLGARLVDTVEVAVIPVLLGGGIPLLPPPAGRVSLKLTGHTVYRSGIISLEYAVRSALPGTSPRRRRNKRDTAGSGR
jgi:dihydrofolate reductase